MAGRSPVSIRQEAEALARAGVAVVVCPSSNLSLQGRTTGARGLAPLGALRAAGVLVGVGLDNVRDVVLSVGGGDPIRMAWLLALGGHLTGEADLAWLGEVVFTNNRRICGLTDTEGGVIRLVAASLAEAVALVPARSSVRDPNASGGGEPV